MIVIGLVSHSIKERKIAVEELIRWSQANNLSVKVMEKLDVSESGKYTEDIILFCNMRSEKEACSMNAVWPHSKLIYISPMPKDKVCACRERLLPKSHWVCNNWLREETFRKSLQIALQTWIFPKRHRRDDPLALNLQTQL